MEGIISIVDDRPRRAGVLRVPRTAQPFSPTARDGRAQLLRTISDVHPEIAGILLVNDHNMHLSNEIAPVTRDSLLDEEWYRKAAEARRPSSSFPAPSAGTCAAARIQRGRRGVHREGGRGSPARAGPRRGAHRHEAGGRPGHLQGHEGRPERLPLHRGRRRGDGVRAGESRGLPGARRLAGRIRARARVRRDQGRGLPDHRRRPRSTPGGRPSACSR